jgi:hypothetical protein
LQRTEIFKNPVFFVQKKETNMEKINFLHSHQNCIAKDHSKVTVSELFQTQASINQELGRTTELQSGGDDIS